MAVRVTAARRGTEWPAFWTSPVACERWTVFGCERLFACGFAEGLFATGLGDACTGITVCTTEGVAAGRWVGGRRTG